MNTKQRHKTDILELGELIFDILNPIIPTFPIIAEKSASLPFAIYKRQSYTGKDTKDRYNFEEIITMEVIICCDKYKQSIELASKIKNELEYFRGTWRNTYISNITLNNTSEDYVNEVYTQHFTFDIHIDQHKFSEIMKINENKADYTIAY